MKNYFFTLLFCFCFLPVLLVAIPLKVAMELSYPPFEMIDKEGYPAGISVEIAYAFGKYLERPIQIENIPFIGLIPALKTGKADIILSSLSITEERKRSIDFSEPYLSIGLCLLVSKKSDLKGITEANRENRTIVVKSGTSGERYALKHLPDAHVVILDKETSCVLEVVEGKADAFIYDQLSIYNHWQKNLTTTRAILTPFTEENWAFGIRKGDVEMTAQANAFLTNFRKEKGIEKLIQKYLGEQQEAFRRLGVPLVF
jgi:polar amino acid transport system substrate-binding protein